MHSYRISSTGFLPSIRLSVFWAFVACLIVFLINFNQEKTADFVTYGIIGFLWYLSMAYGVL